jgi:hypothetical protein
MGVSIVNGYVCMSSCDVAKAKKGEDPHPNLHAAGSRDGATGQGSGRVEGPAVLLGGSLSNAPQANAVAAVDASGRTDPARWWTLKPTVDLLA